MSLRLRALTLRVCRSRGTSALPELSRPLLPLIAAGCAVIAACAGPRFDLRQVEPELTPPGAAGQAEAAEGKRVQWGGLVLKTTNLTGSTEVEVLAYPLLASGRPRADRPPQGRFLAATSEYWDPAEFAPGRLLTIVGPVTGTREGRVGEAAYLYPVVAVEQSCLWPAEYRAPEPRVHFGIGFIFH